MGDGADYKYSGRGGGDLQSDGAKRITALR